MSNTSSKAKAAGRKSASAKKAATGKLRAAGKAVKSSAVVKTARAAKPAGRIPPKRAGLKRALPARPTSKSAGRPEGRKTHRPAKTPIKKARPAVPPPKKAKAIAKPAPKAAIRPKAAKPPQAVAKPLQHSVHKPQAEAKHAKITQHPVRPVPSKPSKPLSKAPHQPMPGKAAAPGSAQGKTVQQAKAPKIIPPDMRHPVPLRHHLPSAPPRPTLPGTAAGSRPAIPGQANVPPKPVLHTQAVAKQSPAMALKNAGFATGDFVVYPTHGVGRIIAVENQQIAGHDLQLFVINFEKDRMTLRVPVPKAHTSGLRRLSTRKEMQAALTKLKGRSRARRTMWSRRAQEYEAKINSGDPNSIAEVVRDLHRNAGQPDQSYSERQIYQAALDRLAREFAAIEKIDEQTAAQRLEQMLRAA